MIIGLGALLCIMGWIPSVLNVPQSPLWFCVATGGSVVDPEKHEKNKETQKLNRIYVNHLAIIYTNFC